MQQKKREGKHRRKGAKIGSILIERVKKLNNSNFR